MFHALGYAFLDSINVLLIGVIVAIGVMLGPRAPYRRIAALLITGDWLGVFLASVPTLILFDLIESRVHAFLNSPVFGGLLIATGILGAALTLKGGDSGALIERMLVPLRTPSFKTLGTGLVLGAVQSLTSFPFFTGLAYLSTSGFSDVVRYTTLVLYATLALSLPTSAAVLVGFVRSFPASPAGRAFQWARERQQVLARGAGYLVSAVLIAAGFTHL